jgi:hypothetical protein
MSHGSHSGTDPAWRHLAAQVGRGVRIVLGLAWAIPMLLLGRWLWGCPTGVVEPLGWLGGVPVAGVGYVARGLAVILIAGAQFVFLTFVADELCPGVPPALSKTLKALACGAVWLALLGTMWGLWQLTRTPA